MAAKWADYLISAVRFNVEETHIVKVRVHSDQEDSVGTAMEMDRLTVVSHLNGGRTFATIYQTSDGKWKFGAKVGIVTNYGNQYIRTHADGTPADNLDNLPRF